MSPSTMSPIFGRALLALALYTLAAWVLIGTALIAWAPGRSLAAATLSHVARAVSGPSSCAQASAIALSDGIAPWNQVRTVAYAYDDGDGSDFRWGLRDADGNSDIWMDGEDMDSRSRDGGKSEPRFWFRDNGTSYVVRDPAVIAEVREAVRPLREIGKQMGEVGGEMGRNGARMGRIGGRLGAVGARLGLVEARLAQRAARNGDAAGAETSMKELRAEMESLRAQLDRERESQSGQQRELSRRMSELSAKHHEIMKDVRQKVREIATRARREGKAERPHANA